MITTYTDLVKYFGEPNVKELPLTYTSSIMKKGIGWRTNFKGEIIIIFINTGNGIYNMKGKKFDVADVYFPTSLSKIDGDKVIKELQYFLYKEYDAQTLLNIHTEYKYRRDFLSWLYYPSEWLDVLLQNT